MSYRYMRLLVLFDLPDMEYITGEFVSDVIDSDERLVIL